MSNSCALPKGAFPTKFKVKSPVHALQLARTLIRPYKNWTTGLLAAVNNNNFDKDEVPVKDPKAEAFCALGALLRVNTRHQEKAQEFLELAAARMNRDAQDLTKECLEDFPPSDDDIFAINDADHDKYTHGRVLLMFRKAIALAKNAAKRAQKARKKR